MWCLHLIWNISLIKDWQLGQQLIFLMAIRTLVLFCIYKFAKTFEKQNQCQVVMLWYVISLRHAHHACFCFVISFRSKSIMMKIGRFKINMRPMLKIGESKLKKKASIVWYWLVLLVWFIICIEVKVNVIITTWKVWNDFNFTVDYCYSQGDKQMN